MEARITLPLMSKPLRKPKKTTKTSLPKKTKSFKRRKELT
jgi:hypothetical protein